MQSPKYFLQNRLKKVAEISWRENRLGAIEAVPSEIDVSYSNDLNRGDLKSELCLRLASKCRKSALYLAQLFLSQLDQDAEFNQFFELEIAAPGFLNFRLTRLGQLSLLQNALRLDVHTRDINIDLLLQIDNASKSTDEQFAIKLTYHHCSNVLKLCFQPRFDYCSGTEYAPIIERDLWKKFQQDCLSNSLILKPAVGTKESEQRAFRNLVLRYSQCMDHCNSSKNATTQGRNFSLNLLRKLSADLRNYMSFQPILVEQMPIFLARLATIDCAKNIFAEMFRLLNE